MLVNLNKLLLRAHKGHYAVGAFNINNLETLQGVVAAAESLCAPVILQTSEGALEYAGMEYLASLVRVAAKKTRVPLVFHLDHGKDFALIKQVIRSGFYTSVMFDGSRLLFKENMRKTRELARLAHARGMTLEAELGVIKGTEDKISANEDLFTDPQQAAEFVAETKCDALAVSIGTSHGAFKFSGTPKLDIERLKEIARLVRVPLVLHGASGVEKHELEKLHEKCEVVGDCERLSAAKGVPDSQIREAIKFGITKVNIDSDLRLSFTSAVRLAFLNDKKMFDPRIYLGLGRSAVTEIVKKKIKLFKGKG